MMDIPHATEQMGAAAGVCHRAGQSETAPYHRRGMPAAGNSCLPREIPGQAEFQGNIAARDAVAVRTAIVRPVVLGGAEDGSGKQDRSETHLGTV